MIYIPICFEGPSVEDTVAAKCWTVVSMSRAVLPAVGIAMSSVHRPVTASLLLVPVATTVGFDGLVIFHVTIVPGAMDPAWSTV